VALVTTAVPPSGRALRPEDTQLTDRTGDRFRDERVDNAHPPEWRNPKPLKRYNLVVIGAGPAGLTAAREAATLGAKVALIERHLIGGVCVNVGSAPSKAIIRTARLYAEMRDAANYGGQTPSEIVVDFAEVMERMRRLQARLSRADSAQRLTEAGIDVFFGAARFTGVGAVEVAGDILHFSKALIATGARPLTPPIPGLAEAGYLTNEDVFDLSECPRRLLVVGGGPFGCELAQAFRRLGSNVILAQDEPMFLPGEERDAAQILSDALAHDGVQIHLNTSVVAVRTEGARKIVELVSQDDRFSVEVDDILVGVGRSPNVEGMNLEAAGVRYNAESGVCVDDFLRTSNPRVYAAGDVCLEHKYTHAAEASARIVVRNALLLGRKRLSALTIPWCTYTDPEIAHVGLYVREARRNNVPVRTYTILMHDVDRAVTDGEDEGFVKIHVRDGTDRILGATVVAPHAGEMINGLSLAITSGVGLRALARVIQAYPTQAGAIRLAADAFCRARVTQVQKVLTRRWLAR
jgi:pyruvate/2-oxoglutarate dehydrogenase complex dihydrolipoamide dehydrogenase (E3) component